MRKLMIAIVVALAAPAGAHAADFVALTVDKTSVAPGWTLSATVTNGSFYRGDEIVGLTLRRSFLGGRAEEQHALRAHPKQTTISFDGRTGRWRTGSQLGSAATVDLAIEATGAPVTVEDAWGCGGGFAQVPVRLTGTLTLRTGTRFFGTIRKTRLTGFVTTETGAVNCDRPGPTVCTPSSALQAGTAAGSVSVAPRELVAPVPPGGGPRGLVPRDDGPRLRRAERQPPDARRPPPRPPPSAAARGSRARARPSRASAPAGRRGRPARRPGRSRRRSPAGARVRSGSRRASRRASASPSRTRPDARPRRAARRLRRPSCRQGAPAPPRARPRGGRGPG